MMLELDISNLIASNLLAELPAMLASRGSAYMFGALIVATVVFTTSARKPTPRCRNCREINRPNARFCAHCGHRLKQCGW